MDNDVEYTPLYMPYGLRMKKEYFRGFGKDELIPTIIAFVICLMIDCVLYMIGMHAIGILFFVPVIGTSTVGMMLIKGELNLSPVDIIRLEISFSKSQKIYPYVYKNEWSNE